jgi:type I restriction enzyme, S subunit
MKNGWQTKTLGAVCEVMNGGTPKTGVPEYWGGSNLWITPAEMGKRLSPYVGDTERKITNEGLRNSSAQILPPYSVILSSRAPIGHLVINTEPMATNQGCKGLIPGSHLQHKFLYYYLNSNVDLLNSLGTGTTFKELSGGKLKEVTIPLPPLPEQQRIVGILDEAFEGIATAKANAEKNLQNARTLFESHLQSVFTQRGKGWVEKRLDEVCTFSSGGTPSKNNSSYWRGEIPWVSGRDMKSTRLSDSLLHISRSAVKESSTRMAPAGALLILVRGMGLAHGAQIAELMVPCAFNQDIRGIHPEPDLTPRYLLFALRDRINSSDTVLSNAAHGTLKIDSDELQSVMIPVPPNEQQQRIVTTIDSLAEETQRLESIYQQKLAALENLKKSLLHHAFIGEL